MVTNHVLPSRYASASRRSCLAKEDKATATTKQAQDGSHLLSHSRGGRRAIDDIPNGPPPEFSSTLSRMPRFHGTSQSTREDLHRRCTSGVSPSQQRSPKGSTGAGIMGHEATNHPMGNKASDESTPTDQDWTTSSLSAMDFPA